MGQTSAGRATPCSARPAGHTTPKKSAAELAKALFRYKNSLASLQSYLNLKRCIYIPMSFINQIIKYSQFDY